MTPLFGPGRSPALAFTFTSTLALALTLALPGAGQARQPPAYKTYRSGQDTARAFRSLTRTYKPLKSIYRANKQLHASGSPFRGGVGNLALLPVTGTYIGMAGAQTVKNVQLLGDAISRGNPGEIAVSSLMTLVVAGFGAGNAWLSKATIQAGKERFAQARQRRNFARRDTVKALIHSPELQRQVNKGQLLPAAEISALKALASALPRPPRSYKPAGQSAGLAVP